MNYYEIQKLYNGYKNYGIYNMYNCNNANLNSNIFMNEVPVNSEVGYIELYVTKNLGKEVATDAVLTIYVNRGDLDQVPVKRLITTQNPTLIELPIAHNLGNLIKVPEYYFTTYNLTIESEGYYKITTLNIRLFPKIKSLFFYNLNIISQGAPNRDEIINIPPHPRDELINGQYL